MALAARHIGSACTALIVALLTPIPVSAHALDESYQLPVPLWLYLCGAFAAVAASFVVVFVAERSPGAVGKRGTMRRIPLSVSRSGAFVLRAVGLVAWFGAMLAGLAGLVHEFLPATIYWTFLWAGLPIVATLIGNPWPALSPFRTLHDLAARLTGRQFDLGVTYPAAWRRWPAVLLLLFILIIELTVPGSELGRSVGSLVLVYTLFTLVGMVVFGPVAWLRNAEVFEVLLGWFGRLAPVGRVPASRELCEGCSEECGPADCVDCPECLIVAEPGQLQTVLRAPLSGMSAIQRAGWSDAAFILAALAGVTFDGLQETRVWLDISRLLETVLGVVFPTELVFSVVGPLGVVGTWLAFFAVFALGAGMTRRLGGIDAPLQAMVGTSAASMLPIAAGYAIAHYGTLLLQGALSLPGMVAGFRAPEAELSWLPSGFVWYLSVGAIVLGHVAAVLLAHRNAARLRARRALLAELPLVALMLAYTVISLWIIAQPITIEAP